MNLATKTMPWTVASLLAATSIFGKNPAPSECCQPPPVSKPVKCRGPQEPLDPKQCAYNAPAEINIGCQGDVDLFATGSFLYWLPTQDNMGIGYANRNAAALLGPPGFPLPEPSIRGNFIEMGFSYHPGFKAGLGMNLQRDDWDGYAEYTRVHGTSSTSSNGPVHASNSSGAVPAIFSTFGHAYLQVIGNIGGQIYNTVSARYKNHLDFADAEMGRTYYVGRRLIFRSAFGARAAWIQQNIHVQYKNFQNAVTSDPIGHALSIPSILDAFQNAHSWGVGPRMGLTMDWLLGWGFRFIGSSYADLLYSKYKVRDKSTLLPLITFANALVGVPVSVTTLDKPTGLRTHLDLEMGLGWGTYFGDESWHIDFSASYGWQVFFNQNMFREYSSQILANNTLPNGNLYVQGLTAMARIDF